jgi:hypothetical protein
MLFQVKNHRPVTVNPQLSRVWIKTGNPRMPLKSVWINEAKLRGFGEQLCAAEREQESREVSEDHLARYRGPSTPRPGNYPARRKLRLPPKRSRGALVRIVARSLRSG